jgi:hypothetical protein
MDLRCHVFGGTMLGVDDDIDAIEVWHRLGEPVATPLSGSVDGLLRERKIDRLGLRV